MGSLTKAKAPRVPANGEQKKFLIQYMESHPHFAQNEWNSGMGKKDIDAHWNILTRELNNRGPHKDVNKWKQYWKDQKKATKDRAMTLATFRKRGTGGGSPMKELSIMDQRICHIMGGWRRVVGHDTVIDAIEDEEDYLNNCLQRTPPPASPSRSWGRGAPRYSESDSYYQPTRRQEHRRDRSRSPPHTQGRAPATDYDSYYQHQRRERRRERSASPTRQRRASPRHYGNDSSQTRRRPYVTSPIQSISTTDRRRERSGSPHHSQGRAPATDYDSYYQHQRRERRRERSASPSHQAAPRHNGNDSYPQSRRHLNLFSTPVKNPDSCQRTSERETTADRRRKRSASPSHSQGRRGSFGQSVSANTSYSHKSYNKYLGNVHSSSTQKIHVSARDRRASPSHAEGRAPSEKSSPDTSLLQPRRHGPSSSTQKSSVRDRPAAPSHAEGKAPSYAVGVNSSASASQSLSTRKSSKSENWRESIFQADPKRSKFNDDPTYTPSSEPDSETISSPVIRRKNKAKALCDSANESILSINSDTIDLRNCTEVSCTAVNGHPATAASINHTPTSTVSRNRTPTTAACPGGLKLISTPLNSRVKERPNFVGAELSRIEGSASSDVSMNFNELLVIARSLPSESETVHIILKLLEKLLVALKQLQESVSSTD